MYIYALLNYFIYICNFPLCRDCEYLNRCARDLRSDERSTAILDCNLVSVIRRHLQGIACSTEEEFYTLSLLLFLSYRLHFMAVATWELAWFRLHEPYVVNGACFCMKRKKDYKSDSDISSDSLCWLNCLSHKIASFFFRPGGRIILSV